MHVPPIAVVGGATYERSGASGSFVCAAPAASSVIVAPDVVCSFTAGYVEPNDGPGYTVIDACVGGGPESPVLELRLIGDQRLVVLDPVHALAVFRAFYGQARLDAAILAAAVDAAVH